MRDPSAGLRRPDLGGDVPVLGLVINPVAGMGGRVGLKGSDGPSILEEARRRGASPAAQDRARAALDWIKPLSDFRLVTAAGAMGEAAAASKGLEVEVVYRPAGEATSAFDTEAAASAMVAARTDLILFVGGDGTARNVLAATGGQVPMLGVPAGVKMHSALFGTTPADTGPELHGGLGFDALWASHEPWLLHPPFTPEEEMYGKEALDRSIAVLARIPDEAYSTPEVVKSTPRNHATHRLKEGRTDDSETRAMTWRAFHRKTAARR
jgi:hypothetical protein